MLKEFVNDVILRNRPEHTIIEEYGAYFGSKQYEGTYSDANKVYKIKKNECVDNKVRSAKAFIEYIKEELKRRKNTTGLFATARIHMQGGNFRADCNYNEGCCLYERLHSEQFNTLEAYNGQVLDHEGFLIMLQKLKPSIEDFSELYKRCSKIRIVGRSEVNSTPIFDDSGEAESGYRCQYRLSDGTDEEAVLPADFYVSLPFVKAGERQYTYHVELLFFNTKSSEIAVKVQVTDWETNFEQAIIDEAADIKEALSEYTDLLVLADF